MNKLLKQIAKFGVVGIICFGIDYSLMILFIEVGKLDYLVSAGISFSVSVVVNYLLSMRFIFLRRPENNGLQEFSVFGVLSIVGLLLTELLMWLIVEKLGVHYMMSKVVVTGIVMVYNFITRKMLLEKE